MSYQLVALSEVLEPQADQVVVAPDQTYEITGIRSFGRGLFAHALLTGASTTYRTFTRLHTTQFVYSRLFGWEGAVAVVPPEFDGTFVSHEFPTFRIKPERALPEYLQLICRWPRFHEFLAGGTKGLGLRRQRVHPERLLKVRVPLPDLDEQRRIAEEVGSVYSRLHQIESRIIRLSQVRVIVRWRSLSSVFARLIDQHGTTALSKRVDVNPETVDPAMEFGADSFRYVDIGSVENGTGRIGGTKTYVGAEAPSRARRRIRAGDVLVATVRPNLRGSALIPPELDGQVCSTGFAVLRAKRGLSSDFLALQVLCDPFVNQLAGKTRGGHYPAVRDSRVREAGIVVPDELEQARAVEEASRMLGLLDATNERWKSQERSVAAVRISVLNDAFGV